jgi:hypothetical protein
MVSQILAVLIHDERQDVVLLRVSPYLPGLEAGWHIHASRVTNRAARALREFLNRPVLNELWCSIELL